MCLCSEQKTIVTHFITDDYQRGELEKVSGQVRQIEQSAKAIESQIKVAKRTATKAEEDIANREKAKAEQV